jgi:hypothetical protein
MLPKHDAVPLSTTPEEEGRAAGPVVDAPPRWSSGVVVIVVFGGVVGVGVGVNGGVREDVVDFGRDHAHDVGRALHAGFSAGGVVVLGDEATFGSHGGGRRRFCYDFLGW